MNKFDEIVNRKNTHSLKYDFALERGKNEDVLPLWVADMDFKCAPEIIEALHKTIDQGIYGYSETKATDFKSMISWYQTHFNWAIQPEWIIKTPGIVFALAMAIKAYTNKGDAVLIQQPVYYPFSEVINDNERLLVNNSLVLKDGHYEIDFVDFENKIRENDVKLFLLCSPHNPVGRVWTKEELIKMAEICKKYQVKIVSDEIHSDFVYEPYQHHMLVSLKEEYQEFVITCTSPSKTFNLAGLQISHIVIPNEKLRAQFKKQVDGAGYSQVGLMGIVASQVAYEKGETWLTKLKAYLVSNIAYVKKYLEENIPSIHLIEPEGTYLLWLDCRDLHLTNDQLEELIVDKAKLWLDSGAIFGKDGEGFQRINVACPRQTLTQALVQLKEAVDQL